MPSTRQTLDELTFSRVASHLKETDRGEEAGQLESSLPQTLGVTLAELNELRWGEIQNRLRSLAEEEVKTIVEPYAGDSGDFVLVGQGVDPRRAAAIMRRQDTAWSQYKAAQSLALSLRR